MKLEQIDVIHLRMPLRSPFETSFGRSLTRDCLLIIVKDEGIEGYGECVADWEPGYSSETVGTEWHILQEFILPTVVGTEIAHPKELRKTLSWIRGHRMAKAGLEMALWDLYGKQSGQSLKTLLGGRRDRVEVGVSVGIQESPQKLVQVVEDYLQQGYARVKLKIKPGRDVEDVQAVRRAFPTLRLQVDANSAYHLENAFVLKPLDALNLLLIEQPLDEEDLWDHHHLQKAFQTPLCLDESILSLQHARQALEIGACRIINIKAGRVGGLAEAVAIHDHCLSKGAPVWCGGMLETGVGRASNLALASLPGFTLPGDISATDRYYEEDITEERFVLNADSTIDVPDQPGLGVTLNHQAVKKYQMNAFSCRNFVK
ncbi:MAG: o-succinylbenzoate synthase [Anaerolineae bacterium]|jgi:O-succinylbenzoate synthase|nr:MAG: o-succinylbenzoate synthase [Anaerolineae bacterium]